MSSQSRDDAVERCDVEQSDPDRSRLPRILPGSVRIAATAKALPLRKVPRLRNDEERPPDR